MYLPDGGFSFGTPNYEGYILGVDWDFLFGSGNVVKDVIIVKDDFYGLRYDGNTATTFSET